MNRAVHADAWDATPWRRPACVFNDLQKRNGGGRSGQQVAFFFRVNRERQGGPQEGNDETLNE
jgi:hypothetical protein